MPFSFFKLRPKPTQAPSRPRPQASTVPKVMVGGIGTAKPSAVPAVPAVANEADRQDLYKKLRRKPTATEMRVGDPAMNWLLTLPLEVRPLQCCKAHPHVVNHLAGWWDSPEALTSFFSDLLHSPRKGRAGFTAVVERELRALFAYARSRGLLDPGSMPGDDLPSP